MSALRRFRSPWFYWYTGHKKIALVSMTASAVILWATLVLAADFTVWIILLAVLLDAAGFWLAILYLLVLRSYVPEFIGLKTNADTLIATLVVVPLLVSFFVTRAMTFLIARACGYTPPP